MSKYKYEGYGVLRDTEINFPYHTDDIVELLDEKDQNIANLEAKLAESEKQIKDAREAGNMAVDSWCKNRRKYEAQIAEMQNKSFILYSMLYETLEKQGCDNVASQIDQMTGWTYDKEADWLKGNRNYDQLKQQLAESESKRKSLEEKVKWLSEENEECFIDGQKYNELREQKDKQIAKLKQSQKQLAIKELEKLKEKLSSMKWCIDSEENTLVQIIAHRVKQSEIIDNQINELREMK